MKKALLIIFAIVIFLILVLLGAKNLFAPATKAQAISLTECQENYYEYQDIIGYFRDVAKKESYYVTHKTDGRSYSDWCVVKAILWWGGVFEHYSFTKSDLEKAINNIFPEEQVYFGLIPSSFVGAIYPQKGFFCTVGICEKKHGYFANDEPFKNIYGKNLPNPPRFVKTRNFETVNPPPGFKAGIIMKRMDDLHYKIFVPFVAKGACNYPSRYPELQTACQYFQKRTTPFTPTAYNAFMKLPQY